MFSAYDITICTILASMTAGALFAFALFGTGNR
jgi:hypothetical protein